MITLKNLAEASSQEVFDQSALHLLKQGRKSLSKSGKCVYRSIEYNLRCAAGTFISDDEYSIDIEGGVWGAHIYAKSQISDNMFVRIHNVNLTPHYDLICDLQKVHDNTPPGLWRGNLSQLAEAHGLSNCVITNMLSISA